MRNDAIKKVLTWSEVIPGVQRKQQQAHLVVSGKGELQVLYACPEYM